MTSQYLKDISNMALPKGSVGPGYSLGASQGDSGWTGQRAPGDLIAHLVNLGCSWHCGRVRMHWEVGGGLSYSGGLRGVFSVKGLGADATWAPGVLRSFLK